jgi:phosphoglycolate phosphatase-like HAD superfamily hydrolase
VFNLDTDIDVVQHHGSTDPLILVKVLVHHGISRQIAMSKLAQLTTAMVDHFHTNKARAGEGLEVLPGVRELLEELSKRDNVCVCLVTGNMEPIGLGKMEALDLDGYFNKPSFFGGFGSDHCSGNFEESWKDRAEFVRIAAQKAEKLLNSSSSSNNSSNSSSSSSSSSIKRRVHVGDAPMDVQAAVAAGAKALGLTTGIYTKDELLEVAPEAVVLDGLEDIDRVLEELGLEVRVV